MSTHGWQGNGSAPAAGRATGDRRAGPERAMASALGAFSMALGAPQVAMPGRFAELIGVRPDARARAWTKAVGVREIVVGTGLLSRWRPAGWLWARVAGDAMDLALLGAALGARAKGKRSGRLAGAIGAVAGVGMLDAFAAARASRAPAGEPDRGRHAKAAITIWKPREEVYGFWHDLRRLPSFMTHVESVEPRGGGLSHWQAKGPAGGTVEWDAEIVEDRPNELIAWRSVDGERIRQAGAIRFAPAPRGAGTEVVLDLAYMAPAGGLSAGVARLLGEEPGQQVEDDLRRFKQVMETGEVVRSEGSPEGTLARRQRFQRSAQPHPTDGGSKGGMS
jgi:uncharacterized membrane protein